ncbi:MULTISPECIES: 3'-5' exonuclease [unclassified Lentimicrobium]|uniref:3'-5' exonuclease n=1 Tax=unclassified Lentimicrobium TaxID=2677434 RepID=UPI001554BFB2|nr:MULTISPECIES: 3'-5' exonuclease [unclassified Lentimicrobium]NPD47002.1 3'-5' exonuclease [Lentimicrobium sp. S6]NPD83905.1 3'-5' exonuclease [Lentimicrobium sp. L6]
MELKLKRPIAFLDLETTGIKVATDRIVEISIVKIHPDGKKEIKTRRVNPEMPIPVETSEIHGIYDEDVKDEPNFKALAKSLDAFLKNCDLAGYNSNRFDIPLLAEEFLRAGVDFDVENRYLVDVQNVFHKMEQRTLVAAYKFYCEKELINAHSAEADTIATFEIMEAMLDKYEGVEFTDKKGNVSTPVVNNVKALSEFSTVNRNVDLIGHIVLNDNDEEIINFGKHKGRLVAEVFKTEPSYYDWMMRGQFPEYTKKVITKLKLKSASQGNMKLS